MKSAQITTIDPSNGETLRSYQAHSDAELQSILELARSEFDHWRKTRVEERASVIRGISAILRDEKARLAELIHKEMGKRLDEAQAEIEKCALAGDYYADNGARFLEPIQVQTDAVHSFVCFEPLGTVLAIMPWNFPFWQAIRCAFPAILAGNSLLLKHASNVTGCALAIQDIVHRGSGRSGLLQTVLLPGEKILPLIESREVSAVSFTGSTPVGRKIAEKAGASLKKCVLELGGSDPYIILEDADIERAATVCAHSRLINAGQSCISAKRFIVERSVASQFTSALMTEMQKIALAPLAREDLRRDLHDQVERTQKLGARLRMGGKIAAGSGFFYPATVLSEVSPGMPAFDEELFGPVAAVIEADSREHAIQLANMSQFGLGAAIFSRDFSLAEDLARKELDAGSVFVNAFVRSDPRLPFGGIKNSGYGRELSRFGLLEFTNVKTVYSAR